MPPPPKTKGLGFHPGFRKEGKGILSGVTKEESDVRGRHRPQAKVFSQNLTLPTRRNGLHPLPPRHPSSRGEQPASASATRLPWPRPPPRIRESTSPTSNKPQVRNRPAQLPHRRNSARIPPAASGHRLHPRQARIDLAIHRPTRVGRSQGPSSTRTPADLACWPVGMTPAETKTAGISLPITGHKLMVAAAQRQTAIGGDELISLVLRE